MKIYVAGPLTASTKKEVEANVERAIDIGTKLIKMGHTPFVPHLAYMLEQRDLSLDYETMMAWDHEWMKMCDALYYIDSSPGTDRELKWMESHGRKIFYSLEEIDDISW